MDIVKISSVLLLGLFAVGCLGKGPSQQEAKSAAESQIRKQAAFELQCDAQKLELQQLDASQNYTAAFFTYGVKGCEKQGTYKAACASAAECTVGKQ